MNQVSAPNGDAIEQIEIIVTSIGFSTGRESESKSKKESIDAFNASSRQFTQLQSLMVKVSTREGLIGWGEAFGHKSNPATIAALTEIVGPYFIGRTSDPAAEREGAERAFHAFGRTGPVHYALSAIDTALWDITAQRSGLPLRKLLNPAARDSVSAYASLVHYGEDPEQVTRQLHLAHQAGFSAFKLHESTLPAIAAARRAVGASPLMVDVNCKWTAGQAQQMLQELSSLNLLWLEEPVFPPDDSAALRLLNRAHRNIAAGENHSGTMGLISDMESGALGFAQPSVGKIGGISAMLEVLAAGERHGVPVVPHCFYYGPALVATAQLIASTPASELPELEVPFVQWEQLLHPLHSPHQADLAETGHLHLPSTPGLGFDPDPEVLARHQVLHRVIR